MTKQDKRKQKRLTAPDPTRPQGNGNPPTKTTMAERSHRINMLAEMILQGARRSQINAYLASTEVWHPDHPTPDPGKVSIRTIDLYLQEARKVIEETAAKKRDYLLSKALEQMDDLYYKSYKIQDYRNCRQIIKDRNELTGLLRMETTHKKTIQTFDFSKYSKDDLVGLMREARGLPEQQGTEDIMFEEMPEPE